VTAISKTTSSVTKPRSAKPAKTKASGTAPAKPRAQKSRAQKKAVPTLLQRIEQALEDGKAEDIVVIDMQGKTSIADTMVIATGRSQRQLAALAERVKAATRETGAPTVRIEGMTQGDWVLVDAGDVIVHIFRPEVRKFYNLEKMWGAALPETREGVG
jgi:ribosome-associated protein